MAKNAKLLSKAETEAIKELNAQPETGDAGTVDLDREMSDEEMKKVHDEFRASLRDRFDKWIEVSDEEATKEEVDAAMKEFDEEVKKVAEKTYVIIEKDGLPYARLLRKWNAEYNTWENGEWRGVIAFEKWMKNMTAVLEENPERGLEMDYNTLMYLYKTMSTPRGRGLESALRMAEMENYDIEKQDIADNGNFVTYSHILQNIFVNVKQNANVDKKLKLMRERINIMRAGIRFDWKITELEEFIQFHDAWVCSDLPDDEKELRRYAERQQ